MLTFYACLYLSVACMFAKLHSVTGAPREAPVTQHSIFLFIYLHIYVSIAWLSAQRHSVTGAPRGALVKRRFVAPPSIYLTIYLSFFAFYPLSARLRNSIQ